MAQLALVSGRCLLPQSEIDRNAPTKPMKMFCQEHAGTHSRLHSRLRRITASRERGLCANSSLPLYSLAVRSCRRAMLVIVAERAGSCRERPGMGEVWLASASGRIEPPVYDERM